jgi:NhaP-type Na+/H+ or K+/H+ antiporter
MRSVLDFYRARPVVGVLVFVVGLAIAVATTTFQKGDGIVLPIAFTALMGILVGSVVAVGQRNRREEQERELERALDAPPAEPEPRR